MKHFLKRELLEEYGFKKRGKCLEYELALLEDSFLIKLKYDDKLTYEVYDLFSGELYVNHLNALYKGEFVEKLRFDIDKLLLDVKEKCSITRSFDSSQANRLNDKIKELYQDEPLFLWDDCDYGVFRHSSNLKWYAIIMDIDKKKLGEESAIVDIINVKIPSDKRDELLKEKGIYMAYHMNKKHWISIILDETLSDQKIMSLISQSYFLTSWSWTQ